MQSIFLGNNKFVGSVTLTKLPKSCIVIDASHNSFSGSINLKNIGRHMQFINLSHNKIKSVVNQPFYIIDDDNDGNFFILPTRNQLIH